MDGIADMGGTPGWGSLRPPRDEPVFADPWQGRVFALVQLCLGFPGYNLDAYRHACERLDRSAYLDDGYYGRWLNAAELMLTETAVLAPGAIDARVRTMQGEHLEEPPVPEPAWPAAPPDGERRTADIEPAFVLGERVRAKDISPTGHTRLAGYVRGRTGVVEIIQPITALPDTHAHHLGENPEHVYTVRFDARELWGAGTEPSAVTIEMFESYLEKAE